MLKSVYLERYALQKVHIHTPPSKNLGIVVTIPCYNEPDLLASLISLHACELPECDVEVIVVINHGENASKTVQNQNETTYTEAVEWAVQNSKSQFKFHIIYADDLPKKHAGVGLARKIAMDEATRRFSFIGNENGVIVCFDADSLCQSNYLQAIDSHFKKYPKTPGCSIYYEHPLTGNLPENNYKAIIDYELFLRYYTHCLNYCGLPYAYQTVGSSMAVRSNAYQKQGGMNKRHAGEDFYFLHKIIALGNFTNLTTTMTIPSARESDRVPFGTGKAVGDWLKNESLHTYNPKTFEEIKTLIALINTFFRTEPREISMMLAQLPTNMQQYLEEQNFVATLEKMKIESSTPTIYKSNFFKWLNAFRVLKMVHYYRDHYYKNVPILEAANWILTTHNKATTQSAREALIKFRELDKNQ